MEAEVESVPVYFPGPDEHWISIDLDKGYQGGGFVDIPVDINSVIL